MAAIPMQDQGRQENVACVQRTGAGASAGRCLGNAPSTERWNQLKARGANSEASGLGDLISLLKPHQHSNAILISVCTNDSQHICPLLVSYTEPPNTEIPLKESSGIAFLSTDNWAVLKDVILLYHFHIPEWEGGR